MDPDDVAAIRSFNRSVSERIGALSDAYLTRSRPLGASRVLWEVGPRGSDARSLRARLGLDAGYLSRLLRTLEGEGLIAVEPDLADTRVRAISLSEDGIEEWGRLDQLSDQLASSFLDPLTPGQRGELVDAARTVERLFTAGLIEIGVENPASQRAQWCIESYFNELNMRFDGGFNPAESISAAADELIEPHGLFMIASLRDEPVGCGALKFHPGRPAEIKRMWVGESARGLGLGRRILTALERQALDHAVPVVRLETNRALVEAISLYRSAGYQEVAAFNSEPFAHHWFEKRIAVPGSDASV